MELFATDMAKLDFLSQQGSLGKPSYLRRAASQAPFTSGSAALNDPTPVSVEVEPA